MRNGEITTISGSWSSEANAWVSEDLCLTGDCWLEISLPDKGRLVVKKSESTEGPWPKCFISPWCGPEMRIRFYGSTKYRYVRLYLTANPDRIQFANTKGYATGETMSVHPKSETAAYLQGEIARNMFPAVAMAVCPKCHEDK